MKRKLWFILLSLYIMICAVCRCSFAEAKNDENESKNYTNMSSITLPTHLTVIGNQAFENCSGITSISIPDSITKINDFAFSDCTGLSSITLPKHLTTIGHAAFQCCSGLTSISIPDKVTEIGEYAFNGCTSLKSITIPDSVTKIGEYAFCSCHELISITIPNYLTTIESGIFMNCRSLKSITIPSGVTSIGEKAFDSCISLTSVSISNSVTTIGSFAFKDCTALERLSLPDSIVSMGEDSIPPRCVVEFGSNSVIESYCKENLIQYVCDNKSDNPGKITNKKDKINWVIQNFITPDMSEYTKALTLYNWVCKNVRYDYEYLSTGKASSKYGVSGTAALLDGTAVCQGFAESYQWLLQAVGIDAKLVTGRANNDSHAWIIAKIDGKWYQFDPTWDEMGDGRFHNYFALCDEAMRADHTQKTHLNIVCNSYNANYIYRTGVYDKAIEQMQEEILASVSAGVYSGTIDISRNFFSNFYDLMSNYYMIALIVEQKTDWPFNGRVDITPYACRNFEFVFHPDESLLSLPGDAN